MRISSILAICFAVGLSLSVVGCGSDDGGGGGGSSGPAYVNRGLKAEKGPDKGEVNDGVSISKAIELMRGKWITGCTEVGTASSLGTWVFEADGTAINVNSIFKGNGCATVGKEQTPAAYRYKVQGVNLRTNTGTITMYRTDTPVPGDYDSMAVKVKFIGKTQVNVRFTELNFIDYTTNAPAPATQEELEKAEMTLSRPNVNP